MAPTVRKIIENKWYREVIIFLILCLVAILNDRTGFVDMGEIANGLFIFIVLYVHLQLQRFLVLPLLAKGQYFGYLSVAFALLLSYSVLAYSLDHWLSKVGWYDDFEGKHWQLWLYYFLSCLLCVPPLLLVFYIVGYYKKEREDQEKRILLNELELQLLRSQLDPHFLFNSMNNLYGISLEKPQEVSIRILQLSSIMRYQIQLSKMEKVSLEQDLLFITDYIALETQRLGERCHVQFDCSIAPQDGTRYTIAPLILITFIENCFKHVALTNTISAPNISIVLSLKDNCLKLSTNNSYCPQQAKASSTGIGLTNVKKRLDILYTNRYKLTLEDANKVYQVTLEIDPLAMA